MVAALVSPTTAPRAWRIVPAPMNPTPVTIWAATRVVSVPAGMTPVVAVSIASERCVYSTDPMQMRMLVRSPAGLPPSSRSRPIAPPSKVASPSWSMRSRRKISTARASISRMEESHLVPHVRDRALRERARATRTIPQAIEHPRRVALQRRRALAQRRQRLDHVVSQHALAVETAPPRRPALLRHLRHGVGRREALMDREDVTDLRRAGIFAGLAGGIGNRRPELLPDRLGGLEQPDGVSQALRHLGLAVEAENAFRLGQQWLRLGKEAPAVARVPTPGNFAHQLEMLDLILTDGHETSFIEKYVSRLQHGVRQQSQSDAFLALRLVFVLGLALELAERGYRREEPVELGVLGDVRLYEHDAFVGVQASRKQTHCHIERQRRQGARVVGLGDGMQVDDAKQAIVLGL